MGETTRICDEALQRAGETSTFHPLMRLQTLLQSAIFALQSKQNNDQKPRTMKGKHFNANVLLTAFFGLKKEQRRKPETTLLHTLMVNRRAEQLRKEQPTYRSVTAFIH